MLVHVGAIIVEIYLMTIHLGVDGREITKTINRAERLFNKLGTWADLWYYDILREI